MGRVSNNIERIVISLDGVFEEVLVGIEAAIGKLSATVYTLDSLCAEAVPRCNARKVIQRDQTFMIV